MSDDIRGMSAELAADPTSLVFLRLGEALRQAGRLEPAAKVALQGLTRYPNLPEAHDLYARVLVDHQDLESAFDEWDTTLRLDPAHGGAHKGLAFLYWQAGDLASAKRHLEAATADLPGDRQVLSALAKVQEKLAEAEARPVPAPDTVASEPPPPPRDLLAPQPPAPRFEVEDAPASAGAERSATPMSDQLLEDDGLLLVDAAGMRLLGTLDRAGGIAVADRVAAELAGVSKEANRAARLLALGEWKSLALETGTANFVLAAPTAETLLLLMRDTAVPMGRVAIGAARAVDAARRWLEESA
ncbi:MAG: tetratricopeptide repeat protein [Gemmatimonadota bacterium]